MILIGPFTYAICLHQHITHLVRQPAHLAPATSQNMEIYMYVSVKYAAFWCWEVILVQLRVNSSGYIVL